MPGQGLCLLYVGPPLTPLSSSAVLPSISADGSDQPDVQRVVGNQLAAHKPRLGLQEKISLHSSSEDCVASPR